ncbi:class I SAM-dependent methyltransferase [Sorangium sp. So ce861]|uniref:class I SAM-dependent methyltransferase n=1 Tax=Sorangium sp. So ce861 TaxID=3133323 RepID=UPI003F6391A0
MRSRRPSLTASLVAALRALYTEMPEPYRVAPDPLAARLVPWPLALPARALPLAAGSPAAARAVHRGLGLALFGLSYHVALRTRAIDDALREAVARGASQLVVLGAGLDSRAMRLPELAGVQVFEVDHPSTQRYKVERLASLARRDASAARAPGAVTAAPELTARGLAHVPVDFERDRLDEALLAAGFRPAEPTFWIWEGVTVYLTREAIEATLRLTAALSAPGSRIALTYGMLPDAELPAWAERALKGMFRSLGEPVRTPLAREEMRGLLARAGFRVLADDSTVDWAARYWPPQRGVRAVERLAVAER